MENEKTKVVIYARVSTKSQDINSQISWLFDECEKNGWEIVKYFADRGVSGLSSKIPELEEMLEFVFKNNIDKIVTCEVSRLGRNIESVKKIITNMCNVNVSIYFVDIKVETLKEDGALNTNALTILNEEIKYSNREIDRLKSRLSRGYNDYIQNGGKVGRKTGYQKPDIQILFENEDAVNFLKNGYSFRLVSLLTGRSVNTLKKVKQILVKNGEKFETSKRLNTQKVFEEIAKDNRETLIGVLRKIDFNC